MAERSWQVQEAHAPLSSLIDEADAGRPQRISRRGKGIAVIMSAADYDRLMAPRESLVEFFRNSSLAEAMPKGRSTWSGIEMRPVTCPHELVARHQRHLGTGQAQAECGCNGVADRARRR